MDRGRELLNLAFNSNRYDAKRVIVRQGHRAEAFYFILSGSVVVMVTDPETNTAQPVAYLYKGMTFGVSISPKLQSQIKELQTLESVLIPAGNGDQQSKSL